MGSINWLRMTAGGLVAALIGFFTDGLLHERLVDADWNAVYAALKISPPDAHGGGLVYFAIFELGRGFVSNFVYAGMRSRFGPGPATAALAGIVAWIAFSVTGPAQFIPLGFFSTALWAKVAAYQLVTSILAAIAGAALYKESTSTSPTASGA